MSRRHIVLVGLPGSGKSSAGRIAAEMLGAGFVDVDADIEREHSLTIGELFRRHGEAWFRERERYGVRAALDGPAAVVAPGGGWAAEDGNLEAAEPLALIIYMRVAPATAVRRLKGAAERPLLAGAGPAAELERLLAEREPAYRRAAVSIDTEQLGVSEVADRLVELARLDGGW